MESLSIQAVSKIVGITPFTLRAWERRYRVLKPKRSDNGRRAYTLSDVEKLRLICTLKNAGHSLPRIANLSLPELTQLLSNTSEGPSGNKQVFVKPMSPSSQLENLFQSISTNNFDQLASQLKMLQLQLDAKSFLLEIVSPLLRNLGQKVMQGELDIFHEHAVSALLKHILTGLLYATERATDFRNQNPIIFATPEGDHHEFGALMASILAMVNGHRVFYLGSNMPADSLSKAADVMTSALIVVACSAPAESLSPHRLHQFLGTLLKGLPEHTQLWLGGARVEDLKGYSDNLRPQDRVLLNLEEFDRNLRLQLA